MQGPTESRYYPLFCVLALALFGMLAADLFPAMRGSRFISLLRAVRAIPDAALRADVSRQLEAFAAAHRSPGASRAARARAMADIRDRVTSRLDEHLMYAPNDAARTAAVARARDRLGALLWGLIVHSGHEGAGVDDLTRDDGQEYKEG
jgi:hypothetical protein